MNDLVNRIIKRTEEGKLDVNTSSLWSVYEKVFNICDTTEEVKFVMNQINALDEFVADIKIMEIESGKAVTRLRKGDA